MENMTTLRSSFVFSNKKSFTKFCEELRKDFIMFVTNEGYRFYQVDILLPDNMSEEGKGRSMRLSNKIYNEIMG